MLRESIEAAGEASDLEGLTDVSHKHIDGVPESEVLLGFVDAFIGNDTNELAGAREKLLSVMGEKAMVDAAGVASNFQRMVRIADSTGIPAEEPVYAMAGDLMDSLNMNALSSSVNSRKPSWLKLQILRFIAIPKFRKMIRAGSAQPASQETQQ